MSRKVKILVNEHTYLVEVDDLSASPLVVKVNGQPYQVDVETIDEGAPAAASSPPVAADGGGAHRPTPPAITQSGIVTAPMPGNIVEIYVQAGEEISKGQQLCSLEAMKMQNVIRSSRDGTIATVAVQPGQAVGHGELLFTFK